MEQIKKYYTYMVKCRDGTIYSGYTVDLQKRVNVHNSGKGAKYTRARLPVKLAYYEEFLNKKDALKREREFKKYTHKQKEYIIKNNGKEFKENTSIKKRGKMKVGFISLRMQ